MALKSLGLFWERLKLGLRNDACGVCRMAMAPGTAAMVCEACTQKLRMRPPQPVMTLPAGELYAATGFPFAMKRLLYDFKFQPHHPHAAPLSEILIQYRQGLNALADTRCVVIPVPPHSGKKIAHVPLVARPLASHFGEDFLEDALRWERPVETQHRILSRRMRYANLAEALSLDPGYRSRLRRATHLLVVDDLLTTGATLGEAMRALCHAVPQATVCGLAVSHVPMQARRWVAP